MTTEKQWPFPPVRPEDIPTNVKHVSIAEIARLDGISLLYCFDRDYPKHGGYTLAYRKSNGFKSGYMIDVAVSYCSRGDMFDKKIGRSLAITNLNDGKYIQVPALRFGEDYIHQFLREMFSQY